MAELYDTEKYLTAMGELCFNNGRNLPVKNNLTTMVELYYKENILRQWENFVTMGGKERSLHLLFSRRG